MRRLRVTSTMKKQLADLHESKSNKRRGGVMLCPRMLSIEAWEALAIASQERLIAEARDDPRYVVADPMPGDAQDVTERYQPSPSGQRRQRR